MADAADRAEPASQLPAVAVEPVPETCAIEEPLFLQMGIRVDDGQSQKLAALLLEVRKECLRATSSCLPVLETLRLAVWPHVQAEINGSLSPWMPGWNLEPLRGILAQAGGVSGMGTKISLQIFRESPLTSSNRTTRSCAMPFIQQT